MTKAVALLTMVEKVPKRLQSPSPKVEIGYFETWNQMNQQYISNTQQIAALKQQHKIECFDLDQDASDELWKTSFLPKVKGLEEPRLCGKSRVTAICL